jgi:hypothetical protein
VEHKDIEMYELADSSLDKETAQALANKFMKTLAALDGIEFSFSITIACWPLIQQNLVPEAIKCLEMRESCPIKQDSFLVFVLLTKAKLAEADGKTEDAEKIFLEAIETTHKNHGKLLTLIAAIQLVKFYLKHQQQKSKDGKRILEDAMKPFLRDPKVEEFLICLQEAKALLSSL